MQRSTPQVGPRLAIAARAVLVAVAAVAVLAQVLTAMWFVQGRLGSDFGARRTQWGEGLVLGAIAIEVVCVAAWALITLGRQPNPRVTAMQRLILVIAIAAGGASVVAVWLTIMLATWRRPNITFIVLFAGAAVLAAGVALLTVVLRQAFLRAAERSAAASRLQAELDAVI